MEFRLLGPVEVWSDGERVTLGGPKPRALLAVLLLAHGRVLSMDRLVDQVWSEDPPPTARALIQSYVSSLRRALGGQMLETRPPGYVLHLPPDSLDLARFEWLTGQGRKALAEDDPERAAGLLRTALNLWRGAPLGGIGEALRMDAHRLDELRLAALEDRAAADLALDRTAELLSELPTLLADAPLRERLRGHLITALYRVGRQADALATYHEGRRLLADELGVDPSPELRRLYESIIRADEPGTPPERPAPEAEPVPEPPAAAVPVPTPAQLPPSVSDFVGRDDALGTLVEGLTTAGRPVWLVSGTGGVGKSTLAVQAAHRAAEAYPDGQLYAHLRGAGGPQAGPGEVIGGFLRALGVPDGAVPDRLEDRVSQFRSLVSGRRMLLVLDDAGDEAQVRPLLPGTPTCAVLLTSRNRLAGLDAVARIELDVLSGPAAVDLLARIVGPERVAAEPDAAAAVVRMCGHLPLAVRVAGARLAIRRHWTPATLQTRLADERRRLDELRVGDLEVRATFALSFRALDDPARTAFARLGLLGLPDFPCWVLQALLGVPEEEAEEAGEGLVDAQLLEVLGCDAAGRPRYRMHDLLRVYAAEQADAAGPPAERAAALERVVNTWLWLLTRTEAARAAVTVPAPAAGAHALPPEPGAAVAAADAAAADPVAWFAVEEPALCATVDRAAGLDLDEAACALATALAGSAFAIGNRFRQWHRAHTTALAAARRAGNLAGQATLLAGLGRLRYEEDRYADAEGHFEQALPLFESAGDSRGVAEALAGLGAVNRERGRFEPALDQLTRALTGFRGLVDHAGIGYTARLAASVHLERGDHDAVPGLLGESLEAYRRIGSVRGEALALRTAGLARRAVGDHTTAADLCTRAAALCRSLGDVLMAAYADQAAAKARIRLGETDGLRAQLADALQVCRDHTDPFGEGLVLRTLGELSLTEGRLDDADCRLGAAVDIWEALGLPLFCARARRDLAAVREAAGDAPGATALRAAARQVFAAYGSREHRELSG
ncbi:tetratricopeptide repeat protein [Streptomyces bambusae]|uniref:AfsR/SARP family transcriptional regulator n=1 Tax=Streptomyces bambusae TaxID=1550616 RepID=UPI001CFFE182|nr:AfsR/SARP family transcriptional regulator [Streptomyces bambusae]MCB5169084.1 tetratricopeptide repeat protein [Streptomyces bambusae]